LNIGFIKDYRDGVIVKLNNLQFYVESWEEFFIICEVFIDKDYNFLRNQNFILIDIGCNIGIASLFFSQKENIKKIYSFEPVKETYKNALINFELNAQLASKIEVFNYGIGDSDKSEVFLFDKNIKGNTGIRGSKSINYKVSNTQEKIEVLIKNASNVFEEIILKNVAENFVCKIDCEGAEYEILKNLDENNLVSKVTIFMIEWHDEGAKILEEILVKNNFIVFSRDLESNTGMLHAYNTKH
jgi:FkbM family methyltransferase